MPNGPAAHPPAGGEARSAGLPASPGGRLPFRGEPRPRAAAPFLVLNAKSRPALPSLSEPLMLCGDAYEALDLLPAESVSTVVTSPPYWSLRDYGVEEQTGAVEPLDSYIQTVTRVFRKLRRVLRDDGSVWLNVGDVYTSGNRTTRAPDRKNRVRRMNFRPRTPAGLKPKDLIGIPWRLAFALQADGWWLRSEVIWTKPNAHPESVRDRPTKSHETVFLLTKQQDYHYDLEAVRGPNGRRLRTTWEIPTDPQRADGPGAAHPAVMPLALARRCIAITCRAGGVVLDPYAGSGTTLLAARQLGRCWVGIELNPDYVQLISRRLSSS